MSAAVLAEHRLARRLRQADIDLFVRLGVPPLALARSYCSTWGFVGREHVVVEGGRFEFSRYLPEREARNAFTLVLDDLAGDPADILAFRPDGPVALWTGAVAVAGEDQVLGPRIDDALDVHDSVLDWLKAGRRGIVILNAARAADVLAGAVLRARTPDHARRLRASLTRPAPQILVATPAVAVVQGHAA